MRLARLVTWRKEGISSWTVRSEGVRLESFSLGCPSVTAHLAESPGVRDFPSFIAANQALLDKRLPFEFYSEHRALRVLAALEKSGDKK